MHPQKLHCLDHMLYRASHFMSSFMSSSRPWPYPPSVSYWIYTCLFLSTAHPYTFSSAGTFPCNFSVCLLLSRFLPFVISILLVHLPHWCPHTHSSRPLFPGLLWPGSFLVSVPAVSHHTEPASLQESCTSSGCPPFSVQLCFSHV